MEGVSPIGLDISYYRNCTLVEEYDVWKKPERTPESDAKEDEHYNEGHFLVYAAYNDPDMYARIGEPPGWYEGEAVGGFRAGSYSGYNAFRAELCRRIHHVEPEEVWQSIDTGFDGRYQGAAFVELIHFADNEGAIGPETSAKLAKDFENHDPFPFPETDGWMHETYEDFKVAFQTAADGGFVLFH